MPHAGLMDEKTLGPVEGPMKRAQLHIRGGKRRLRQGKIAAGIATLYDAVTAAFEWYAGDPARRSRLTMTAVDDLRNDRALYRVLVRNGVLDGQFDFEEFERVTERALQEELPGYDYRHILEGVESLMKQLGVMPFDEAALPPEDAATY